MCECVDQKGVVLLFDVRPQKIEKSITVHTEIQNIYISANNSNLGRWVGSIGRNGTVESRITSVRCYLCEMKAILVPMGSVRKQTIVLGVTNGPSSHYVPPLKNLYSRSVYGTTL